MKEALMELNFGSKPFHYKVDIFYGAERPRLGRTLPSASVKASDYRNSTLISCQRGKEDLIIDDLTATNSTTGWLGGIGSERVFSGRTHFEATCRISAEDGFCRVGWSQQANGFTLGENAHCLGYRGTGAFKYQDTDL
jgi:hypothetical protein